MAPAMSRRIRQGFGLLLGLTVAVGLVGCGLEVTGPNPSDVKPTPTGSPPATPDASASPAAPATSASTVSYPATARAYAEAVLTAWGQKLDARLGDLTAALVHDQIISIPGPPNLNWSHDRCDAAAGSTYCVFVNDDGDVITLRITNALLGKPRAATEVRLDQTVYSNDVKLYVQAFVEAWRNGNVKRMHALSTPAGVEFFTHYTPPGRYQVCAQLFGTAWRARIYNSDGVNYRVIVADAARGTPHAITSPIIGPMPPECT